MTAIYNAIAKMAFNPEAYPLDNRKMENKGSHQFLIVYSYRISYEIRKNLCVIKRIQHTKQDAKMY